MSILRRVFAQDSPQISFVEKLLYLKGGDLASTWVAKLKRHVEDVTHLVKHVTKHIVANLRNFARAAVRKLYLNDEAFADVAAAAA